MGIPFRFNGTDYLVGFTVLDLCTLNVRDSLLALFLEMWIILYMKYSISGGLEFKL